MKSEKVGRLLTLAGNIGVIAGLVLVAIQIHQNTEITRAQIANDYFLADMSLELAMMGEDPAVALAKAVYEPDVLTRPDAVVLDRYFNYGLVQLHRFQEMEELGMAPENWEKRVGYLRWHLGNEIGRRWWREVKDSYPEDFRQRVDEILESGQYASNRRMIDALLSEAPMPGE